MYFHFQQNGEGHRCVVYVVIEFTNDTTVAVVSHRRLKSNSQCRWPVWQSSSKLARVVQNHVAPESDWKLYKVKILKATAWSAYIYGNLIVYPVC